MRIKYEDWNPKPETIQKVNIANSIIAEYQADDLMLTVRQLYYAFVSKDLIVNDLKSYKNFSKMINNARMSGMLSWAAIEDRTRQLKAFWYLEDPDDLIEGLHYRIRFDRWERQENYVEVWVEKEALINIVQKACDPWLVPHVACKGYMSSSALHACGKRMEQKLHEGKFCTIIHLGDHDPSGIDMTRDNNARVNLFNEHFCDVEVKRIALNMDQIEEYDPPPNPAKTTDSRSKDYIKRYGGDSWELDALEPRVMIDMIDTEISGFIDMDLWDETAKEEAEVENSLKEFSATWFKNKE